MLLCGRRTENARASRPPPFRASSVRADAVRPPPWPSLPIAMMAPPITTLPKVMTSPKQQQAERHSGRTVGEDEVAQSVRIEREQSAEHQHGRRRTQREINGEQAKQWLKKNGSGSVFHRCLNRTTADYSGLIVRLRRPAPTFCTRAAPA